MVGLSHTERTAAFALAALFGTRMLGLFIVLPVFSLYSGHLAGATPFWIGIAIGIYGLTQACLQIPMGLASDRFGRKPLIYTGLLVFALGSLIAAFSDQIWGVVLGRALQGAGAISSVVLALAADLTRPEHRPKVMGIIGVFIGIAFTAAMVIGPTLAPSIGLHGLFLITAGLALLGMLLTKLVVPDAKITPQHQDVLPAPAQLRQLLADPQLRLLDLSVLTLHLLLSAAFVAVPLLLIDAGMAANAHWLAYLPAMLLAFVLMVPVLIAAAKTRRNALFMQFSALLLAVSLLMFGWAKGQLLIAFALVLFFTGFNYLEASLPALISRVAPAGAKGGAMGIFSTSQFLGAFLGGTLGGSLVQWAGSRWLVAVLAAIAVLWAMLLIRLREPGDVKNISVQIRTPAVPWDELEQAIAQLPGVCEVTLARQMAYLKVNTHNFEPEQIYRLLGCDSEIGDDDGQ